MATSPFDFSAVAVHEADLPKNGAGRNRKHEVNPFTDVLAESFEAFSTDTGNAGRSITLPGKNAGEAVYLIRQAADDLGIGARVIMRNSKGENIDPKHAKDHKGNVTVLFSGKNRKQRKAVDAPAESDATEGTDVA